MGGKGKSEVGGAISELSPIGFTVEAPIIKVDSIRAIFIDTISLFQPKTK
jgi:hypothetical protein